MCSFYKATIESILHYGINSWFGNRSNLRLTPQDIFEQSTVPQANRILSDHFLCVEL